MKRRLALLALCWLCYRFGYDRALEERAWPTSIGGACYIFEVEPEPSWSPQPIPPPLEFSQSSWRVM